MPPEAVTYFGTPISRPILRSSFFPQQQNLIPFFSPFSAHVAMHFIRLQHDEVLPENLLFDKRITAALLSL